MKIPQPIINKTKWAMSLSLLAATATATNPEKPNIVFFLIDDMGWSDLTCYGSDYYETPNIDRLTENGVRFTNAYAACTVSSPTRASILTGKYPGRLHITGAIPILGYKRINQGKGTPLKDADYVMNLPLEEVTIAESLKSAGYATASIGKWHVCDDEAYYPEKQGFDINIGGGRFGNTQNYFYPYKNKWRMAPGYPYREWKTLPDGVEGEYITDRLTSEATKFIEKNANKPFFLYFPHYAVHTPIQAKQELEEKYRNKPIDAKRGHKSPEYAAMIESVDQSIAAVMKKLESLGIADNTIIIFTSDNGGHYKFTSNYPFRGNKGNFYEGGIRVPLIINWPGVTKTSVVDNPVISNDFYPTLLEMVNLPLNQKQHCDGLSLVNLLKGKSKLKRDDLFWHFPNYIGEGHLNPSNPLSVIRHKNYKLIESLEDGSLELYDLKNDPQEKHNLATEKKSLATKLQKKLDNWRKKTGVQMPEVNPDYVKNL